MQTSRKGSPTLKMVELAILTAIVAVLQLTGTAIHFGTTSISLVLIPIVLGAILIGPAAGAWLGFEFGLIVYLMGVFGADAFTFILYTDHPVATAIICFGKGAAAGWCAGALYRLIGKKHPVPAVFAASAVAPVVNTGLFILGALTVQDTLTSNFVAEGSTVLYFLIVGCAGFNFIFEFALNLIVSPALCRIVEVVQKQLGHKPQERQE